MILYDVLLKGCDTPLTREQVAELFHAGQIDPHHPCKLTANPSWRTIDEIFPLLKYDSTAGMLHPDTTMPPLETWKPILLAAGVVSFLTVVFIFAMRQNHEPLAATTVSRKANSGTRSHALPSPAQFVPWNKAPVVASLPSTPRTTAPQHNTDKSSLVARLERDRQAQDQLPREQAAQTESIRAANKRKKLEEERAAGTDHHIPLDQNYYVTMPGGGVWIKIHDNDVTTFDVSINGAWRRNVRKEKGISHSGTDETYIYGSGGSSLYYVWEISGKLNHCLLRVR